MSILSIEDHLNSFRQRTKIRGNTFYEKLTQLVLRLEKVVSDCENSPDKSPFRTSFALVHKEELECFRALTSLNFADEDMKEILNNYVKEYLQRFADYHQTAQEFGYWDWTSAGTVDALCYILVELEEVLK